MDPNTAQSQAQPEAKEAFEQQLSAIWREILEISSIGTRDNFFDLGGTSLEGALVIKRIRKVFGRELRLNVLFENPTVQQLAKLLREDPEARLPALFCWKEAGTQPPLFCLPGAAGDLAALRGIWLQLPDDVPVYGIDYDPARPGVIPRVEELAAARLNDILAVQPEGPYYLLGLCFGALVAFEMARQLAESGRDVAFLGLLDPPLPGLRERPWTWSRLTSFTRKMAAAGWRGPIDAVRNLGDAQSWKWSARWNALLSSCAVSPKLAGKLLNPTALNVHAAMQYHAQPYSGSLTVFLTDAGGPNNTRYAEQEWRKLARETAIVPIPGDHNTFVRAPHVGELSEKLLANLRAAQASRRKLRRASIPRSA